MKRPKISRIALATALASLGLADFSAGVAAQGVTDKAVKIGAYDALTGPIPLTGKQMSAGWQTAVQAINAAGGINGRTLEQHFPRDTLRRSAPVVGLSAPHRRDPEQVRGRGGGARIDGVHPAAGQQPRGRFAEPGRTARHQRGGTGVLHVPAFRADFLVKASIRARAAGVSMTRSWRRVSPRSRSCSLTARLKHAK